jgi:hypothetical protein
MSDRLLRKNGVLPPLPTKKEKKPLRGKSLKLIEKEKKELEEKGDIGLDKWFEERRKEMSGVCANCGSKTGKHDDKFYRHSVAHILAKRKNMFPSVALNSLNWVELCFWGNSCHSKFDSSFEKAATMRIWPYVIKQINILYPLLTPEEKARIRGIEVIAQEIKPENF